MSGESGAASLSAAVADLQRADLTALSRDDLLALTRELEAVRRRLDALDHLVIAELDGRGVAHELALRDTETLLGELLRLSPAESSARVAAARHLGPRRDLAGQLLAPLFPVAAAAQAEGSISAAHARVITRLVERLPAHVEREHGAAAEAFLTEQARTLDPRTLGRLAERLRDTLDPDGRLDDEAEQRRRRDVRIRRRADGTGKLDGELTPAAAAAWQAVLDALSAPAPAEDGQRDDRSAGQRRHDAFLDAGLRLLRSGALPDCGGTPVTILATVTADQLAHCTGYATTAHGELISVTDPLALATEAEIVPVVLNDTGGVLAYGRTRRLATPAMRQALAARDGGCSFPGCSMPPGWTQAHHVRAWIDGGDTDLSNLTLLCGFHHREHERLGWTCRMNDGVPVWIPPAWLDPQQQPRRNSAHALLPP